MALVLGKSVPAYLTHAGTGGDRLGTEAGVFSGFYRDGNRVRAKNFNFLDAFRRNESREYEAITELAAAYPDQLGISPVMRISCAWVMADGTDMPCENMEQAPEGAVRPIPSIRVRSVQSCDFVKQPAAKVALFEAKVDGGTNKEPELMATQPETVLLSKHTEELTALTTQHKDAIAALETKHKEAVAALEAKVNEATAQIAKLAEAEKGITAALAAKTIEAEEAAKYDMRKAGGEALKVALDAHSPKLPEPAKEAQARWAQYAELAEAVKDERGNVIGHKDTPASLAFKQKYLSRK